MNEIASTIRFHRKRAGLTQKQLATLAGVGKTAVFDIEKGKETIRLSTLTAVCAALNIEIQLESPLMSEWTAQSEGE
jgi:HTH-type transcriptional regulator/antitoxin HipB